MNYRLLTFNLEYRKEYRQNLLRCKVSPYDFLQEENDNYSSLSVIEEYDYPGFEMEPNAIKKVCTHAARLILKRGELNQNEAEHLSSRNKSTRPSPTAAALSRDYNNAILCLEVRRGAKREEIDGFTKYMLFSDWETVAHAISGMYERTRKLSHEDSIESIYVPDYGKLWITEGDYALLRESDFEKAIKEYELASLMWQSRNMSKNPYTLAVSEKEKIKHYIDLYVSIKSGYYLEGNYDFLCENEKTIINHYVQILEKKNKHESIVDEIERLIEIIEKALDQLQLPSGKAGKQPIFESDDLNTLRTITVILPRIYQIGYLGEVQLLSGESHKVQKQLEDQTIEKVFILRDSELDWLYHAVCDNDRQEMISFLFAISKVCFDIQQIKKALLMREPIPELAYYTTWQTLSYLLPSSNTPSDENVGRFSIMHLSYMNDPMEGIVLKKYLFSRPEKAGRKQEAQPYVFVKCFTPSIDYLPMWQMYGDNAMGCCLVVDWNKTMERNVGKDISLYRVCYLSKKGDGSYEYFKKDNDALPKDFPQYIQRLKDDSSELQKADKDGHLLDSMLEEIAYLFKDSDYCYEKEARILYSWPNYNRRIKRTEQDPPKLFVYPDYRIVVKEIILGPKFKDVFLWSPFIKMQLEKMNDVLTKTYYETSSGEISSQNSIQRGQQRLTTKLSLSAINYR